MILPSLLEFLRDRIGLDAHTVGVPGIEASIQERMRKLGLADISVYRDKLVSDTAEQQALIDAVVVPETWFFRDQTPFHFLAVNARKQWNEEASTPRLRFLSLPCSTGEEPYSIAMTLLDAGYLPDQFQIDAVDVSEKSLAIARAGRYTPAQFRGRNLDTIQRYFHEPQADRLEIIPKVRDTVHFAQASILDLPGSILASSYHAIFCRNLLIYLNNDWRQRSIELLSRLLRQDGILFVGHADATSALSPRFSMVRDASAFAYYPRTGGPTVPTPKPQHLPPATTHASPPTLNSLLHDIRLSLEKHDAPTALALCEQALALTRMNAELHYLTGAAHELQGKNHAAKDAWQKSLYLQPRHVNSLQRLKKLLELEGNHAAAARMEARLRRAESGSLSDE